MRKMIIAATVTAAAATLAVASIAIATATSTTKTETFTVVTTDPGSGVASVIATGGFTAGGTMTNREAQIDVPLRRWQVHACDRSPGV